MAKLSTEEMLDAFKEMTLLELSEFVKQFEETFGVTAAAPVAVAAAAPAAGGAGGDAGAAEEKDEFEAGPGEGQQGVRGQGQGGPRGRRRHRLGQVVPRSATPQPSPRSSGRGRRLNALLDGSQYRGHHCELAPDVVLQPTSVILVFCACQRPPV